MDEHQEKKAAYFDSVSLIRDTWKARNRYYYFRLEKFIVSRIPPGKKVLEIGCGTGDLLAATKPSYGVGIDISRRMIDIAAKKYPGCSFFVREAENLEDLGQFDYVIMSDLLGHLQDILQVLREMRKVSHENTKLLITYYNFVWEPVLRLAERLHCKMRQGYQNWLGKQDIRNLLYLTDFTINAEEVDVLIPKKLFLGEFVNNRLAQTRLFKWACLLQYFVAQPQILDKKRTLTCSVVVPSRNERDNIEDCVRRIPDMGAHTEIIFVDGASTDGTEEKIREMIVRYDGKKDIRLVRQVSGSPCQEQLCEDRQHKKVTMLALGKGDAVRKGFEQAKGDIVMILDSDLTVPPEDLPKFFNALADGKADFINGSRLVYPLENEAMPVVNYFGNKFFSLLFTWLLDQPIKDTLCGTKALFKKDYQRIKENRSYFGDFDPFGDFDLLFGAAKLGMKIVEMPVAYRRRTSGYTKVKVYKHGLLLLRMSVIAFRKFKLDAWLRKGKRK